jgi:hypothetical protein
VNKNPLLLSRGLVCFNILSVCILINLSKIIFERDSA